MKKTGKKFNFKSVATRVLVPVATGAAATIVATMVEGEQADGQEHNKNAELVDYGMLAVGAILPEVVKGEIVENASNALLAVGAYRMAQRLDLPGKVGINGITNPVPGQFNIGNLWNPSENIKTKPKEENIKAQNVQ